MKWSRKCLCIHFIIPTTLPWHFQAFCSRTNALLFMVSGLACSLSMQIYPEIPICLFFNAFPSLHKLRLQQIITMSCCGQLFPDVIHVEIYARSCTLKDKRKFFQEGWKMQKGKRLVVCVMQFVLVKSFTWFTFISFTPLPFVKNMRENGKALGKRTSLGEVIATSWGSPRAGTLSKFFKSGFGRTPDRGLQVHFIGLCPPLGCPWFSSFRN